MQSHYWKLATLGIALTSVTALSTGLTTAWMLRPTTEAQAQPAPVPAAPPMPFAAPVSPPPAPRVPAAARASAPARVTRVPSTTAADCGTGGERALRIAKPGAIGALLGAGLGAGGGAIAGGGKGAGKGALIGGLAGAAAGAGYGAYKTKNECGTIFGGANGFDAVPAAHPNATPTLQTAAGDHIQVYGVQR